VRRRGGPGGDGGKCWELVWGEGQGGGGKRGGGEQEEREEVGGGVRVARGRGDWLGWFVCLALGAWEEGGGGNGGGVGWGERVHGSGGVWGRSEGERMATVGTSDVGGAKKRGALPFSGRGEGRKGRGLCYSTRPVASRGGGVEGEENAPSAGGGWGGGGGGEEGGNSPYIFGGGRPFD